jgi:hypothetical protein
MQATGMYRAVNHCRHISVACQLQLCVVILPSCAFPAGPVISTRDLCSHLVGIPTLQRCQEYLSGRPFWYGVFSSRMVARCSCSRLHQDAGRRSLRIPRHGVTVYRQSLCIRIILCPHFCLHDASCSRIFVREVQWGFSRSRDPTSSCSCQAISPSERLSILHILWYVVIYTFIHVFTLSCRYCILCLSYYSRVSVDGMLTDNT